MKKSTKLKTKRFEIWLDKNVVGSDPYIKIIEMPADATQEECEDACRDCLEVMISNEIDSGWRELDD